MQLKIVDAVEHCVEILVVSGIRRSKDVLKALAHEAKAVLSVVPLSGRWQSQARLVSRKSSASPG